jgi:multiple sugar transport system substrate-binding protein
MLDAMCRTTTIAYCPLVYGYVNYAGAGLRFCDAPRATDRSPWGGSTLGGTGLAVSSRCDPSPQLVDHICWLMSETAQRHFIPAHDGQPSSRDAWLDPELDRRSAGFYSGTLQTIESAWTRPRHTGFIRIQTLASETIRRVVLDRLPITDGITALRRLVADHAARGTVSVGRAI